MKPQPTNETAKHHKDASIFSWLARSYLTCNAYQDAQRCADLAQACWLKVRWDVHHDN